MNSTPLTSASSAEPLDARPDVLVDAGWLEAHLTDPAVRIVEVDVSRAAHDQWHIGQAALWNVYTDLKDSDYGLVGPEAVRQLLEASRITPESTVVFYGYAPAMGFWLMKLYRHADARILDCSRDTWQREGRPCDSTPSGPAIASYPLGAQDGLVRAGHTAVLDAIGDQGATILDVRSWDEYRGERFWPSGGMEPGGRAGHVPSAVHLPVDDLYDDRGAFRPADGLRGVFRAADQVTGGLITYCTIGGRASTAWFVLTYLLGWDRVRVYDGSWAEWGRMPGTPVDTA
jgi:thiosulfate/3-mercaptopyruvate sulfurtransferase